MNLALDICQGIGLAAGVGVRPFLPALLVGALASDDLGVNFDHTRYAFLEKPGFLLGVVVVLVLVTAAERLLGPDRVEQGAIGAGVAGIGVGLGALFFAGSLAEGHFLAWPGLIAGILCAVVAQGAARSLFRRTRARLDADAARGLPFYAEGAALVIAGLTVLLSPLGVVAFLFLAWLLISGRRREGRKYAGLRILR